MLTETIDNGIYKCFDEDRILLTITSLGDNIYRAVNSYMDITAEVSPIDEYTTRVKCIKHKRADRLGRYRETTKLLSHNLSWLDYMLEEKGFIRKKKCKN